MYSENSSWYPHTHTRKFASKVLFPPIIDAIKANKMSKQIDENVQNTDSHTHTTPHHTPHHTSKKCVVCQCVRAVCVCECSVPPTIPPVTKQKPLKICFCMYCVFHFCRLRSIEMVGRLLSPPPPPLPLPLAFACTVHTQCV